MLFLSREMGGRAQSQPLGSGPTLVVSISSYLILPNIITGVLWKALNSEILTTFFSSKGAMGIFSYLIHAVDLRWTWDQMQRSYIQPSPPKNATILIFDMISNAMRYPNGQVVSACISDLILCLQFSPILSQVEHRAKGTE